ncbi:type III-A CRISPR-associated protein Cas10/Csm1 [Thermohalobacter berrensis]|uniref:CRISPR system single-strand-specific deoxyribonuclease Cas10/Csm1 (subtype III-A) n=1 Tax=Thermohalobacter berrensis TaxID=99594 RepID=A0A419T1F0_9FIRM|nr:type III-A CRISPR-associated protein Cas10/Csm1 [Thermohalobacter berrensis]RKD31282.1 type III-A CRISPR-associated protein Cas10/Csm1 [Thermohalobacter berrensis]
MSQNYQIALAALVHDIGKIMQRAKEKIKSSLKGQENVFCKYTNNYYSYKHSLYTVQFIEDYLNNILAEEYLKVSAKHHVPETELEKIVARADRLSAGLDRREYEDINNEESKRYNYINTRLYSIFSNINIGKDYKSSNYFYDLFPLEVSEKIFPQKEQYKKRDTNESVNEYRNILNKIYEEFQEIDFSNSVEEIYNTIHGILEKYTTFIPSSTINYPDISLFDHLKTTAAIATCLYEVHKSKEKVDNEFILLEGDVSGIQNFIYRIVEGEETKKNIAKSLRGRSAYVNVLIDFISKYIVKKLNLTISNVLYCGGGKFQLLLPNTQKVKEKIEEIEKEIQFYLYDKYKTKIGLVLAYIEIGEKELKNYADCIIKLTDKMNNAKNKKFINIINFEKDNFFIKTKKMKNLCKYCHVNEVKYGTDICKECDTHIELGGNLVKDRIKYVVYDFQDQITKSDICVEFGKLGKVHFFRELPKEVQGYLIENINNTGNIGRIKFIGNIVPLDESKVASFNTIAELSEGDSKIGVLKMDIDNLGTIFSRGLSGENRSISRISTLSRMIDLFFSGYINKICQELFEKYKTQLKEKRIDLDNIFYINYSGGDDLLLIGPWDWTLKLALEINRKLEQFVCKNPNITLSAGIYICDSKTPIRITSEDAENYLELAKSSEGKNSVCVFGEILNWYGDNSLEKSIKEAENYKKWLENKHISRGLVYNIMIASKNFNKENRPDLDIIPRIAYSLSRNITDKDIKNYLFKKLITSDIEDSELDFIKVPLIITLMKTRKTKEA